MIDKKRRADGKVKLVDYPYFRPYWLQVEVVRNTQ